MNSTINSKFSRTPITRKAEIKPPPRRPSPYSRVVVDNTPIIPTIKERTLPTTFSDSLILIRKSISQFSDIEIPQNIRTLDLQYNLFENFEDMPSIPTLETLDMSNNPLNSLQGFPELPHLKSINVSRTPLAMLPNYKVALLILAGKSLRVINGERISNADRHLALSYPKECASLLKFGWSITFPAPKESDIPSLYSQISKRTQLRTIEKNRVSRIKPTKNQSDIVNERLSSQEKEIKRMEEEIKRLIKNN